MATFTNQPISASYQRVLQIDGGQIQDGLGNAVTASILGISASQGFTGSLSGTASYAATSLSSSHAQSSSFSLTASFLQGTASLATSASYALTASYVANASSFPFTGSAIISGSLTITGSLFITGSNTFINEGPTIFSGSVNSIGGFTGSLVGTASNAAQIIDSGSSGRIDIASVRIQWGTVAGGSATGTVTFPAAFANSSYTVTANIDSTSTTQVFGVQLGSFTSTNFAYSKTVVNTGGGGGQAISEAFRWIAIGLKP